MIRKCRRKEVKEEKMKKKQRTLTHSFLISELGAKNTNVRVRQINLNSATKTKTSIHFKTNKNKKDFQLSLKDDQTTKRESLP